MSTSPHIKPTIFLVQPLDKKAFKEMIVYADNKTAARKAAALAFNPDKATSPEKDHTVYLDEGLTICIEINPNIVKSDTHTVQITYNEVVYNLTKNVAQEVIAEDVL